MTIKVKKSSTMCFCQTKHSIRLHIINLSSKKPVHISIWDMQHPLILVSNTNMIFEISKTITTRSQIPICGLDRAQPKLEFNFYFRSVSKPSCSIRSTSSKFAATVQYWVSLHSSRKLFYHHTFEMHL